MTDGTDRFLLCLPCVLKQEAPDSEDWSSEANFSHDAHDPGGATMNGIIQSEYDLYRIHKGEPTQSVKLISEAEGEDIYRSKYWMPHCPNLPEGLDLCFFDEAVNTGTVEAIKVLQHALGIANDGIWGPQTDAAVKAIADLDAVIAAFSARREAVYKEMSGFQYFGRGWTARVSAIDSDAKEMIA